MFYSEAPKLDYIPMLWSFITGRILSRESPAASGTSDLSSFGSVSFSRF